MKKKEVDLIEELIKESLYLWHKIDENYSKCEWDYLGKMAEARKKIRKIKRRLEEIK